MNIVTYVKIIGMEPLRSLYGNEYWRRLREYRDSAVNNSRFTGNRRTLGRFTLGTVSALWRAEEGGVAHLLDQGMRSPEGNLFRSRPTRLTIIDEVGEKAAFMTSFEMDLDTVGSIEVYQQLAPLNFWGMTSNLVKAKLLIRENRKHDLAVPTEDQLMKVLTELERGATGYYAVFNVG